jgi:hypothetical protein
MALLTKEVAIVLLPLPLVVWVWTKRGDRVHGLGCGAYVLAALVVVTPWVGHVYNATGSVVSLAGSGRQVFWRAVESGGGGGPLEIARQYLGMVEPYYRTYVADRFILAPLWVVSWLSATIALVVRPSPARAILVASGLLFSPIALVTAKNGLRAGQTLFLYQLSCVAAAVFLNDTAEWLARLVRRGHASRLTYGICATSLTFAALTPQLVIDKQWGRWVKGQRVGNSHGLALGPTKRIARKGWVARHLERAARRIQDEVPPGSVIMSDWHWRTSLYFFGLGSHRFIQIPYVSTPWPSPSRRDLALREGEKPLFIFPRRNTADNVDVSLLVLTQSELMTALDRWSARWVVVTERRHFLAPFFDAHPGFSRRAVLSDGRISLYERTGTQEFAPFETRVGSNTARWLEAMHAMRPRAAAEIERFLVEEAGLTEDDLEGLREGRFPQVSTVPSD